MDFTKEQIAEFKAKHGHIFKYTASDGKSCILKAPDLLTIDACKTIAGNSSIQFDMALVENCWVAGDEELRTVDKYRLGLFEWLGVIIVKIEGELVEL